MVADCPKRVVIVGCGFTGTTALHQLVELYPVSAITVIESQSPFGPGFPYQPTESTEYLINNTNDTMCLDPPNRRAFVEWLQRHPDYNPDLDEKGHMPRAVYGEFLQDSIAHSRSMAAKKNIELTFVDEECLDVEKVPGGHATVRWAGGETDADLVILATGRCPDHDAFGLEGRAGYFATHMPGDKLDAIPPDAEVHVLGASLSAYDVINQLYSPETGAGFEPDGEGRYRFISGDNNRRVVLCSRSGRLKHCQSRHPQPVRREHFNSASIAALESRTATLEQLFDWMQADARDNGIELDVANLFEPYAGCDSAQALNERAARHLASNIDEALSPEPGANFVVDYLEQAQFDVWDLFATHKLADEEEARYRRFVESAFLSIAAPCPIPTAKKILALMEARRLSIVKGVREVTVKDDGFEYQHEFGHETAQYIVNATGIVDRDVTSTGQSTLVRNLVRRGLLRPYQLGGKPSPGAAVDMTTFKAEGARNLCVANMFLWGPGHFTSSAIVMATVVQRLLAAAYGARPI
jgi:uncharacterized NAD(P)/FAD-binding protein YdhS